MLFAPIDTLEGQTNLPLIGINTQRIASELGPGFPELLELCLRSFNSYLRTTINARDPRTAYYLMNQYRIVAERLLQKDMVAEAVAILAKNLPWMIEDRR